MKRAPLFVLFWLAGCGPAWPNAETDGADAGTATGTSTSSSSGATTSLTTIGEPPPEGPCRECRLAVPIEFSTTLRPTAANTRLSSATAQGAIVWAVDVVGPGRVAYSADSQMLGQEADDCGLWEWLGGRSAPRVLGTGFFHCAEQDWNALGALENFTYEVALPAHYVGDPAALRADYDIVLFCVSNWGNAPPVEAQTYIDYVALHGGGLYLAAVGQPSEPKDEIDRINEIAVPLGVEFQKDKLDWEGIAAVDFACFPR